jgi:hypothetical protein
MGNRWLRRGAWKWVAAKWRWVAKNWGEIGGSVGKKGD